MLPVISLDDERFEEIVDKARKMIPNLYPEWTDYNYHDPGITMLELFAWLKEIQQFHMDQIGPLHLKKYLMLLGEKPGNIVPAAVRISVAGADGRLLPRGSRFYAKDIPFETTDSRFLNSAQIAGLAVTEPGKSLEQESLILVRGGTMEIPVFGKDPEGGEGFYIGLTEPFVPGRDHWIYLEFYDPYPVKRNPIQGAESFVPLADIQVEYECEQGFLPVEDWSDETNQFLENGYMRLKPQQQMKQGFQGLYWVRILLKEAEYDVPPVLEQITLHTVEARQLHTLSEVYEKSLGKEEVPVIEADSYLARTGQMECYLETEAGWKRYRGEIWREETEEKVLFTLPEAKPGQAASVMLLCYEKSFENSRILGNGDGFPHQEFDGSIDHLCKDGLKLMIETYEGSGIFQMWHQTEDFTGSVSSDLHYCYNETTGIFSFGDCDRGCVPEGKILLAAAHTSLGQGGNVKAGTISRYEGDLELKDVANPRDAVAGRDSETIEECSIRLHQNLKRTERAITYEDYEALIKRTPGLRIESVKAIPVTERKRQDGTVDEKNVAVLIKPYSLKPMPVPGKACFQGILRMLESRRLIGTRVIALPPEYIGITVFAEIETDSYYQQTRETVQRALEDYFAGQADRFGQPVLYGTIYGLIDVLDPVTQVRSVSLDAQGNGIKRSMNGDILLPVNGLAYLKEWDCMISSAR